jgi:hypothetical protein
MPAALIRERLGGKIWEDYFKFCVIRNPYDKVLSAFYFARRAKNLPVYFNPDKSLDINKERAVFDAWLPTITFPVDRDKYLIDGNFCLDDVIRYETLAIDIQRISSRLNIPNIPTALPTFKAGMRPKEAKTEVLYTESAKKIVEKTYAFEFDYFGYTFPTGGKASI